MDLSQFLVEQALILVPVLYVIGMVMKRAPMVPDWTIPFTLVVLGILGAIGLMGLCIQAVLQGILAAGAAVLTDQAIKQGSRRG